MEPAMRLNSSGQLLALPVKIIQGKVIGSDKYTSLLRSEIDLGLHSMGKLLGLPAKTRLGRYEPRMANTLAYSSEIDSGTSLYG
jgi:hypothetical protein